MIRSARKAQAKNDAVGIAQAVIQYSAEYSRPPLKEFDGDESLTSEAGYFMAALTGEDEERTLNPKGIRFFTGKDAKSGKGGFVNGTTEYTDPWGEPYFIIVDGDFDGKIEDPTDSANKIRGKVLVYSKGPEKGAAKPKDYIRSWK